MDNIISKVNLNGNEYAIYSGIEARAYGVEWTAGQSSYLCTRIGNPNMHKELPIQSAFRGCVCRSGSLNYYLDANDWSLKEDGTASRLDGYDGEVMVETPKFYLWSEINGTTYRVWVSLEKVVPWAQEIPAMRVSAYRSSCLREVPQDMGWLSSLSTNSLISVVNTNTYCRGGSNSATYDEFLATDPFKTLLGKPMTSTTRAVARTRASQTGAELLCYNFYKGLLYWLFVIEYGSFYNQANFTNELTAEGYKQGGLGAGITMMGGDQWSAYNGYNPLTPCGYTNSLGNGTGVVPITVDGKAMAVPRWRGFENPFGDIWTNLDGILIYGNVVSTTSDSSKFSDETAWEGAVSPKLDFAGIEHNANGYIGEFNLGRTAEIIPISVGGSATTCKTDYFYQDAATKSNHTLLVGGTACAGAHAGLGCFNAVNGVAFSAALVGFRHLYRIAS